MPFPLEILTRLAHGLVVSCHVDEEEEAGAVDLLHYFARSAEKGGAVGLRVEGVENVRRLRPHTQLPIIGFVQGQFEDGLPHITPTVEDARALIDAGSDIVAVDGTKRKRHDGTDGFLFFEHLRKHITAPLWADVATFREGVRAAESGADAVATTLAGYTPGTVAKDYRTPDFTLIEELSTALAIPVIAEGRVWDPDTAAKAIALGAHAVVVGSAITRPRIVAEVFANALKTAAGQRR